ncbi:MAG: hypothetical protein ACTH8H_19870, partial [Serratia proteamaculans]
RFKFNNIRIHLKVIPGHIWISIPGNRMNQKDRKPDYRVEYGEEWKPEKTSKWFWILLIAIIGALVAIS